MDVGAKTDIFVSYVAPRMEAHLAFGAVGDADAALDDAVGTGGVRAFAADATGFFGGFGHG